VTHDKFGYGTVLQVEGKKLDIDFDEAGHKRVMAGFVK
jgi:DNA helicase-2/ATP-dependent DNA helicase PcrA